MNVTKSHISWVKKSIGLKFSSPLGFLVGGPLLGSVSLVRLPKHLLIVPYKVVVVASTLLVMVVVAVEFAVVELEVVDVEVLVLKRKRKFLQ